MNCKSYFAGLFHRAILMSGSSFSTWLLLEDPVHYAVKEANSLNCTVPSNMMKNPKDVVKCLISTLLIKKLLFFSPPGPSRNCVLISSDFRTSSFHIKKTVDKSFLSNNCWSF